MSAPSPVKVPERVLPSIPPGVPRRRFPWKLVAAFAILGIALGVYQALKPSPAQKSARELTTVPAATIKIATLERTCRVSGQTSARTYANITAPMLRGPESRSLQLIQLAKSGSIVKKGDQLAKIDSQAAEDHIDDVQDLVRNAENDVLQRRAQQAIEWGGLEQTLRSAKAALDQATADARAAEVRTAIERELLQLSVSQYRANYEQLLKIIGFKNSEHQAEIRILELTLERQRNHLNRHEVDLKKMTLFAPMPGLVVMQAIFRSGEFTQIQVGDTVYPGQPFMKIVQPDSMQVEAGVNQAESTDFRIGQPARISFDAFPGLYMNGKIYSIGAMGIGSWRENYFIRTVPIRIEIDGADSRVIPDLSAAADIQLEKVADAVQAPLESVQIEDGKNVVFVKHAQGFEKREVRLGPRNSTHVAILAGLKAGDVVALTRPN